MTINRQAVSGKIVHEEGFLVQVATESPETNNAIKMEVGIEDCLHIEFEYNKSKYQITSFRWSYKYRFRILRKFFRCYTKRFQSLLNIATLHKSLSFAH